MGSGKSFILLLEVLRHIEDPHFRGVIFRRLTSDITKPGGLWEEAKDLWGPFGCEFKEVTLTAIFPSGARIKFSHMEREDDKKSWQGSQLTFVGFDEATHFSETQVLYMISRMRSKSKVKPYMRLTFNPEGKEHWLYKWVEPYLDNHTGIPDRSKSGMELLMLNLDGQIYFAQSREELVEKFGHEVKPKRYTFIAGNCYDNQALLKNNPDYIANLEALPRVERERLLLGSWWAAMEGAGFFHRDNVEVVSPMNVPRRLKTIRAWDIAVTEPSEINPNPDWTAGVKMSLCEDGYFYVEHATRFRHGPHLVQEKMIATAHNDGLNCPILLPLDPGAQGKVAFMTWSRPLVLAGFKVKKALTRKGKLERFMGFSNAVENGLVRVVQGDWNDAWFYELEVFDGESRSGKKDQVDATADSYNALIAGKQMPAKFKIPSMLKVNEFAQKLF